MTPIALVALCIAARNLELGASAVEEFRVQDALDLLERARDEGPYVHEDHVRLYEQLGIAYAYSGRVDDAIAAFDRMLALDPTHALQYTLSPKATLVFEKARASSRARPTPAIDLGLPRGQEVGDPLPIDVDVLADPFRDFARAKIVARTDTIERVAELELVDPTGRHRIVFPPVAPEAVRDVVVRIHAIVYDARGNEVLCVGFPEGPREVLLRYVAPEPLYSKWWFWTTAGVAVVAGAATLIAFSTRDEDPFVEGRLRVSQ